MDDKQIKDLLQSTDIPTPDKAMQDKASRLAMDAFEKNKHAVQKNIKGSKDSHRHTTNNAITAKIGRYIMNKSQIIGGTVAACALAVLVTTTTLYDNPFKDAETRTEQGEHNKKIPQPLSTIDSVDNNNGKIAPKKQIATVDEKLSTPELAEARQEIPSQHPARTLKRDQLLGGASDKVQAIAESEEQILNESFADDSTYGRKTEGFASGIITDAIKSKSSNLAFNNVPPQHKTRERILTAPTTIDNDGSGRSVMKENKDSGAYVSSQPAMGKNSTVNAPAEMFAEADMEARSPAISKPSSTIPAQHAQKNRLKQEFTRHPVGDIATPYCCPHPHPEPIIVPPREENRDQFEKVKINPFKNVSIEPVSTFSADVDTASYAFTRKQLNNGRLPVPDAVRVEEFINYFDYNYATPDNANEPFKPSVTVMPTPWNPHSQIMHVGVKGYDIDASERPPANLVFLLDVSGSMSSPDKLPLLKRSLEMMVNHLNPDDRVAIAVYAGAAGTVLEPTHVRDKHRIIEAFNRLNAGGSTAGGAGIQLAYALAEKHFNDEGVNRVILATDGDFNVGIRDKNQLKRLIEQKRDSGIYLSVLGFGKGNYNDALMQTLAQNGNGNAAYIDNLNEARKVLIDEAGATLFTIAKDVKIQVEFNPKVVSEYRLLGYETRALKREDFNNDKVDAGEIGAGHEVTALYEVITHEGKSHMVDPLRYNTKPEQETIIAPQEQEMAFVKLRYKLPAESTSRLLTRPVKVGEVVTDIKEASVDARFALSVASFGEMLKGGQYLQGYSYADIINLALSARGEDKFGYRNEFVRLVRLAESLAGTSGLTPMDGLRYR